MSTGCGPAATRAPGHRYRTFGQDRFRIQFQNGRFAKPEDFDHESVRSNSITGAVFLESLDEAVRHARAIELSHAAAGIETTVFITNHRQIGSLLWKATIKELEADGYQFVEQKTAVVPTKVRFSTLSIPKINKVFPRLLVNDPRFGK